ncbi:U4/U6.U5 small nuclear ribonucleoprotein 27 kDa protein-like [Haliotis rufescens]|uniref:U4/U6.U5 small nuclear ribonucleoprotein 27 kDa protein-like n=1 Tax=Haliotis rufescens TaxID=6454 RepID=UPI001EAFCDD4|nr:U4/U6.U5 small nuclear ribonucleoprotein 27 kDa protein-like [Haliotis rufescens]
MPKERSRSPARRDRERRRSRSRERRHHRRRSRSPRGRRSRSHSPRRRSRSASPGRERSNSEDRETSKSSEKPVQLNSSHVANKPKLDKQTMSKEESDMMKVMGFSGFETTKNKKVEGNDIYVTNLQRKRRYRQYMNRRGGFNRPLDFIA